MRFVLVNDWNQRVFCLLLLAICLIFVTPTNSSAAVVASGSLVEKTPITERYIRLAQSTNRRTTPLYISPNFRTPPPRGRNPGSSNNPNNGRQTTTGQTGGGGRVTPGGNFRPGFFISIPKFDDDTRRPPKVKKPPKRKKVKPKKAKVRKKKPRRRTKVTDADRRYRLKQIVVVIAQSKSKNLENLIARKYRLRKLNGYVLKLINARVQTYRIPDRRSVESVLRQLRRDKRILSVQPNYVYKLVSNETHSAQDENLQYSHQIMRLTSAHKHAEGKNIKIAIVDTGIDIQHPELAGSVKGRHNSLNPKLRNFDGHAHGTAIAGIIAAKDQLKGVAPKARLLDAKAFFTPKKGGEPDTDSYLLLRALQWSYDSDARIVNLSFAGPKDPLVSKYLKKLYDKGLILIAAAGNGGPKAKPAYPAAYKFVLATTALDQSRKYYEHANRGKYLTVAAPGVDLMVLSTSRGYQFSSGTSLAAAHISGLAALILEHRPHLTQEQVKSILIKTAKDLGEPGHDVVYGAGLVDAFSSVEEVLNNKFTRN